ncbi:hypothetical protein E1176_07645 [Fulvivirga sp. RKSG066]|uniref:hypothetical protein n=1 Tax=Fulvivirga aurantia TaxID=2529383 RepID=UPI0012BBF00C|nr:hypothetical protein [Fulvivirga aurantia]MTI20890.1 hypothetical protein [Fulvivirga aurantia]
MLSLKTHQPLPADFKVHTIRKTYDVYQKEETIWEWLNDPKTFTDNQIWPYRVEFARTPDQEKDFEEGVFNAHHGPFMSFTGVLGKIEPNYRDLKYLYGSYFLSMRWIRPARLQFWTEKKSDKTVVTMQLDSFVKPGFYGIWNWSQNYFWNRFGRWLNKSVKKRAR